MRVRNFPQYWFNIDLVLEISPFLGVSTFLALLLINIISQCVERYVYLAIAHQIKTN